MSPTNPYGGERRIVFLVGFMGSGKTWLSRRLSEHQGIPRYDLDEEIEREQGLSIGEFFHAHGESAFRKLERETLERLCENIRKQVSAEGSTKGRPVAVVSTGGGTPCFGDNMEWMNRNGLTVWLNTPKEIILARLGRGKAHRPLIAGLDDEGLEAFVSDTLEARRPHYAKAGLVWTGSGDDTAELMKLLEHA